MQNIYVVTHAQSQHHIENRVGGWYDTGLTALGQRQAKAAAARLETLTSHSKTSAPKMNSLPYLISSDLKRAAETADIIGHALGTTSILDPGFRENSYGAADGKPQAWLDERITMAPDDNRLDHLVVTGAESKRSFITRIYKSMNALQKSSLADAAAAHTDTDTTIIIVTHGYALTFVIAAWIGLKIEDAGYVNFTAAPAGITHLYQDDGFRNKGVKVLNDTRHLGGMG